jgi:hypothetical protein
LKVRHSARFSEHPFFHGHLVLFLIWISNLSIKFGVIMKIVSGELTIVALLSPQFILDSLSKGSSYTD